MLSKHQQFWGGLLMYCQSTNNSEGVKLSPNMLSKHQQFWGSLLMYCQSTNNSEGVKLSPNMLSKHQHFWGSLLMYCQSTTLMHLKSHINRCCWVSPNMLSKAPLILRELHLSVSPNVPIPGTNTYWGSHVILAARCSPNVLSKYQHFLRESLVGCLQLYCQSTNVLLREFYLFAVKPVSSSSCLLSHFSFHLRLYKC